MLLPLLLLSLQVAHTYVQRYGALRAWDMAWPPFVCLALMLAAAWRRRWVAAVLPLLFLQHVYYGGLLLFPQMLVHGRSSMVLGCTTTQVHVAVIVVSAGAESRLEHMRLVVAGVPHTVRVFKRKEAETDVGQRNCLIMRSVLNTTYAAPWLLVLEDDAVLHWGFWYQLSCAAAADRDVTFLDARSSIIRNLVGRYEGSSAGMLYKTSAAPRIVEHMCFGAPLYAAVGREIAPGTNVTADCVMAALCNRGMVTCQAWPMVSEAGFATTSY